MGSEGQQNIYYRRLEIPEKLPDNFSELSKNAQKRLLKHMHFEATRSEWRTKKRDKKRARKLAASGDLSKSERQSPIVEVTVNKEAKEPPAGTIIFDMGFNDLMTATEISSLLSQLSRAYSVNRRSSKPFKLIVTGANGVIIEKLRRSFPEYEKWDLTFREAELCSNNIPENTVYLSADANDVLAEIDPEVTLIIGGLVDRNRHKNSALDRATGLGIPCAKLPISNYAKLNSSEVLTVLHVFEILSRKRITGSWQEAILSTIPGRKYRKQ